MAFLGATIALLPPAFTLGHPNIVFTAWMRINVVVLLVFLLASAFWCLRVISTRKATVPDHLQLRDQWLRYAQGGLRGIVTAQMAHAYLAGSSDVDPIRAASEEADSRARWFKGAIRLLAAAVTSAAALTAQILFQQR